MKEEKEIHIVEVSGKGIKFDNGKSIRYRHYQHCCEYNYADFEQLESLALDVTFKEPLTFSFVSWGFIFGNPGRMFFVPCYSEQNGYYSREIDILYGKKCVLKNLSCKLVDGEEDEEEEQC